MVGHSVAVFVDGGFFLKRLRHVFPDVDHTDPLPLPTSSTDTLYVTVTNARVAMASTRCVRELRSLPRVFLRLPSARKKMHWPVSNKGD